MCWQVFGSSDTDGKKYVWSLLLLQWKLFMISQIPSSDVALWVMQSPGFEQKEECVKLKKVIPRGSVGFKAAHDESNIVIRAQC